MTPPVAVSPNQGDAQRPREPSTLYKLIMTPLIFTSFLLSLALVDLRHSALRAHYHADADAAQPSRLPPWLHRIVYRYRPYRYAIAAVEGPGWESPPGSAAFGGGSAAGSPALSPGLGREGAGVEAEDYYHSKQRKLMRMEVAEAFEMRGGVVAVLGLVGLGVLWVGWGAVSWMLGVVYYGS